MLGVLARGVLGLLTRTFDFRTGQDCGPVGASNFTQQDGDDEWWDDEGNYWDDDDITSVSRLGSQLPLTKELDGIQIYIPDGIPTEGNL